MIYISHLLPNEEMKELIHQTGAGVESLDFSISDNLDKLKASVRNYQKQMSEFETDRLTLHGPFLDINPCAYDSLVRKATMTRFAQCYEAGRMLGADKIVFHSGMNPYVYYENGWAERVTEFWKEFLEERTELEIVLENVFDQNWEPILDVYHGVNRPNFKLCLDIGHAHCYSARDVLEWTKNLAPYVSHVHVHDNCGDKDAHIGLGCGNLPWKEVLELVPENETRTWTIECMTKENVLKCMEAIGYSKSAWKGCL